MADNTDKPDSEETGVVFAMVFATEGSEGSVKTKVTKVPLTSLPDDRRDIVDPLVR